MKLAVALVVASILLVQPTEAAPKWLKSTLSVGKTLAEHSSFGAGLYFAGACAGAAGAHQPACSNWQAGLTVAGAAALAKELTDLHDHKEQPKSKTLLDIAEIMAGAGAAAAAKH